MSNGKSVTSAVMGDFINGKMECFHVEMWQKRAQSEIQLQDAFITLARMKQA
jgi:hypothetical protein